MRTRYDTAHPPRIFTSFGLAALILILAGTAGAVPVEVGHLDAPQCDTLVVPQFVDELGFAPAGFPLDEEIIALSTFTGFSSCVATDNPGVPNALVVMTNLTPFDFAEVWYVADAPDTTISNFDGDASTLLSGVLAGLAFRIDSPVSDPLGINHPLVFESFGLNDIFESGETWEFIIQDYSHFAGLPPEFFLSPGLVGIDSSFFSPFDPLGSSGSIIAVRAPVPEPSALLLVGLGLAGVAATRRSRRSL